MPSAFDAYLNDEGVPQLIVSCVLFWDVLGVQALSVDLNARSYLVSLSAALDRAWKRAGFEDAGPDLDLHAVTRFTDNVVVGTPVSSDLNKIEVALGYTALGAAYLQLLLLDAGFLGRGAIAFGPHHMQQQLVFGPALIEAVQLEKKTRWPRVALTPLAADFNRAIIADSYSDPQDSPQATEYLVDEEDGVAFVDHLSVWLGDEDDRDLAERLLARQHDIIGYSLSRETGEVFYKWKWLADMHNHVLDRIPAYRGFRIDAGESRHSFRSFI